MRGQAEGSKRKETWQGPQVAVSGRFPAQFLPRRLVPDGGREGRRGAGGEGETAGHRGLLVALHERGWEVGSCTAPLQKGARAGEGAGRSQRQDHPPPAPALDSAPAPFPSAPPSSEPPWTVCLQVGVLAEACSEPALLEASESGPARLGWVWDLEGTDSMRSWPRDSSCAQNLGR